MPDNFYITQGTETAASSGSYYIQTTNNSTLNFAIANSEPADWATQPDTMVYPAYNKTGTHGIHPLLYFKYVKSKFSLIERSRLKKRLTELQKAFDKAITNGQEALAQKFLNEFLVKTREAAIAAKGVKHFIERDDLVRYKNSIRGGHISDTLLREYTRVIPKKVLKIKDRVTDVFDGFVIYHYWDEKAEDVKKMSPEEKLKMKDPVLFGIIKETNRLYFVAEWDDEFCDLSFREITSVVARGSV